MFTCANCSPFLAQVSGSVIQKQLVLSRFLTAPPLQDLVVHVWTPQTLEWHRSTRSTLAACGAVGRRSADQTATRRSVIGLS